MRFRRGKIASLDALPSSEGVLRVLRRSKLVRWCGKGVWLALALGALLLLVALAIQLVGSGPLARERLRAEAQRAITALAGFDVTTQMGDVRLGLGGRSPLTLEVRDLDLIRAESGDTLLDAEEVRLGFKLIPLLSGRLELGSAQISGVRLMSSRFPSNTAGAAVPAMFAHPLDPWELRQHVFEAVRQTFALTDRMGTRSLAARDIEIVFGSGASELVIEEFTASRSPGDKLDFDAKFNVAGQDLILDGEATRNGSVVSVQAQISEPTDNLLKSVLTDGGSVADAAGWPGDFTFSLSGEEEIAGSGQLDLELIFDEAAIDLGKDGVSTASGRILAAVASDRNALAIRRALLSVGRSTFDFAGFLTPAVQVQDKRESGTAYNFVLTSRRSTVAPIDSPEPAVDFAARIAGRIDMDGHRIVADTIRILTSGGSISASAAVTLEGGKTPGLSLAIDSTGLPTQHAKQFWPWFAAPGARNWVLENLFGGRVVESRLRLHVPPGRFGNGVPLNAEEVSGAFVVEDARFDVAGEIPPVRDGNGGVNFEGPDVDISIGSGTVFMPSGRQVAVSNGTLAIHDAHILPRIGKLGIDIAGDAPAVVELASYEPIDASRIIDFSADDVAGEVTGRVQADIPLSRNIPRSTLGWQVSLDYDKLSIAKPIDDQLVSDAKGRVIIEPQQAAISGSALLNGIPAQVALVAPIGDSGRKRSLDITFQLNDAARNKLIPGLDTILSGPTEVGYKELEDGRKALTFRLDKATLSFPWINWRKGPGIAAAATFIADERGSEATLSDLQLSGETFSVSGTMEISKNSGLISAQFDKVRLNKGDDFSASIQRSGDDYEVTVRGAAYDARAVIKHYLGTGTSSSGSEGGDVTLTARFATVSGFNGEALTDTVLSYTSKGAGAGHLEATGVTRAGGAVSLSRDTDSVEAQLADAGAVMRFLDFYPYMEGGRMRLALTDSGNGILAGQVTARDFDIVNEPRLRSLVAAAESDTGRTPVDAGRVRFEQGAAHVRRGPGSLMLDSGVLRGPLIGTTFQGTLFDAQDNIAITGTFMPLYGINRIFGEIPLFGQILGNGRDRGLIGITYRLIGKFEDPELQINPISAIAPGIFRQIFEFR